MATSSKLNENILFLSSKRTQNICRNLCRFKFVKCRATSNFAANSTSTSKNNVAVSFDSGSKRPPFEIFGGLKVRSFTVNSISSFSTSNSNVADPSDSGLQLSIAKSFNWLKSKIPAVVMAFSLLLGMMMINGRKPALAFPGGHPCSTSKSSSDSTAECIFCSLTPNPEDAALVILIPMALGVGLVVTLINQDSRSIFKIQVGILDKGQNLERDLNRITKALIGCPSFGWRIVLEDTIETLDWHHTNWISGYSSVNMVWKTNAKHTLKRNSYEEQRKFDTERPINSRNIKRESFTSRVQDDDKLRNKYTVVTLLVGYHGRHKLPTISKKKDLHLALKKLKSYNSKIELMGVDILWAPKKAGEFMSREELEEHYPLLRPFNR